MAVVVWVAAERVEEVRAVAATGEAVEAVAMVGVHDGIHGQLPPSELRG